MTSVQEAPGPEKWHGTTGGVSNHRCKCVECRAAWTAYCKRRRAERASQIGPNDPRHGLLSFYYNHSCRCDKCRAAKAKAERERRAKQANS